jgi:hypothetical protein
MSTHARNLRLFFGDVQGGVMGAPCLDLEEAESAILGDATRGASTLMKSREGPSL